MDRRNSPFRTILGWLTKPDSICSSDLIFVLAGKHERKDYALRLFWEQFSPRILFSVGRFELRRFSALALPASMRLLQLASECPPSRRHFFVYMDSKESYIQHVEPKGLGTLTEMNALSDWLKAHREIRTVLIVSSWTHLFRLRMCCKALFSASVANRLVAIPKDESGKATTNPQSREQHGQYLLELAKIGLYATVLTIYRIRARTVRDPKPQSCEEYLAGQSILTADPISSPARPRTLEDKEP